MSMYGESREEWNHLYAEINYFLLEHSISELLKIVHDSVERKECDHEWVK